MTSVLSCGLSVPVASTMQRPAAVRRVVSPWLPKTACWQLYAILLIGAVVGCREKRNLYELPPVDQLSAAHSSSQHGIAFADVAAARGLNFALPEQKRPMRTLDAFGCGCAAFDVDNDGWQDILIMADPHPVLFRNTGGGHFVEHTESAGLTALQAGNWIGCAVADYDGDGWLDLLLTGFHRLALCRNEQGRRFVDVTTAVGLDPQNHERWGSGAGFMDLDGDQWLDLVIFNYVVYGPNVKQFCREGDGVQTSCPPSEYEPERGEIWRNVGGQKFELVPDDQGMASTSGVGLVLAFTDLDDDNLSDFYIGNDGQKAELMHNRGHMRFENIGMSSGIAVSRKLEALAAMGADWGDFDRDGRLDLTVTNFQNRGAVLFHNLGDKLFSDISQMVGIEQATVHRLGFGLNWVDFDNDGWLDVAYVNGHVYENVSEWLPDVSYRQPVTLMRNERGRKFVDLVPALAREVARPLVGRGSASLDFDNDGRMDFLAIDYEGPVMLLHNQTRNAHHWLTLDLRGAGPNRFAYGARITAKAGDRVWVEQVSAASSYLSSEDPRVHLGLGDATRVESLTIRWTSGREQTLRDVAVDRVLRIEEDADTPPRRSVIP